jgi:hypothetical protein
MIILIWHLISNCLVEIFDKIAARLRLIKSLQSVAVIEAVSDLDTEAELAKNDRGC